MLQYRLGQAVGQRRGQFGLGLELESGHQAVPGELVIDSANGPGKRGRLVKAGAAHGLYLGVCRAAAQATAGATQGGLRKALAAGAADAGAAPLSADFALAGPCAQARSGPAGELGTGVLHRLNILAPMGPTIFCKP